MTQIRWVDEFEGGLGWIADELLGRTSHALAADGGVWLIDPVDGPGVEERVRALGEPRGVIQLLDRHNRDAELLAQTLGVPRHEVPFGGVEGAPFELIRIVDTRWWREAALWWPEGRVLAVADALGTIGYLRAPGERLGVHPFLRLFPPRALAALEPERVLCGHGPGVHGPEATRALREALRTSRRRLPLALLGAVRRAAGRD